MVYKSFDEDHGWVFSESYRSVTNTEMTQKLFTRVKDTEVDVDDRDIFRELTFLLKVIIQIATPLEKLEVRTSLGLQMTKH